MGLDQLKRASNQWEARLGQKSFSCLCAYEMGYDIALDVLGYQPLLASYTRTQEQLWIQRQIHMTCEHQSRLNAFNWLSLPSLARLMSKDEQEAIDVYIELRTRAQQECPSIEVFEPIDQISYEYGSVAAINLNQSLDDLLAQVCKRPGMYFGNQRSLRSLWAMLSGYFDAHTDCDEECWDRRRFAGFQSWINERYPFGTRATWAKTLDILSLNNEEWAFESFQTHWEMFVAGEGAQTQDPVMHQMMEAILASGDASEEE